MRARQVWLAFAVFAGPLLATDLAEIRSRGTLRVIVADDEQPERFALVDTGPPGLEREMVEGFARLNNLRLEIVRRPFPDVLPALLRGEGDLAVALVDSAERRRIVDFTREVLPNRHVVVNRAPKPSIGSVERFRAEQVGVLSASSWAKAAVSAGVPASRTVFFDDIGALLAALASGRITATVMSVPHFTMAAKRDRGLQRGVVVGEDGSAAWALHKSHDALEAALNQYLLDHRRGGSWSRLIVKYFGEDALSVLNR